MRSPAVGCEMKSFNENGQNVSDTHGGCDIFIPQNRIADFSDFDVEDNSGYILCFGQDLNYRAPGEHGVRLISIIP